MCVCVRAKWHINPKVEDVRKACEVELKNKDLQLEAKEREVQARAAVVVAAAAAAACDDDDDGGGGDGDDEEEDDD